MEIGEKPIVALSVPKPQSHAYCVVLRKPAALTVKNLGNFVDENFRSVTRNGAQKTTCQ